MLRRHVAHSVQNATSTEFHFRYILILMMASRNKRSKKYFGISESSDSECFIPVYRNKKFKRITVGQLSLKEFTDHSTDEDDNSGPKYINRKKKSFVRTSIKDKNAKFKSRNPENTRHANVKPVIESIGKHNKRGINFRRKYNLDEDTCNSSEVEDMGSYRKIDNRTSMNKHHALNTVQTSTPLPQNKQENKENGEDVTMIWHPILKIVEELKYMLSKFQLDVQHFQLIYFQDDIIMKQEGEDIMYTYSSLINKFKEELTVHEQSSMGVYHRCGETKADSQFSSEINPPNYGRPEVTTISKPHAKNNVNGQPLEANCISAVTVEKNNNTTSKSEPSWMSRFHKLSEMKVVKTSSTISMAGSTSRFNGDIQRGEHTARAEAGSISTVYSVPTLELLNRAYPKTIGRQDTTKQDSLGNGPVKEKGSLAYNDSNVNSTCSTIALYPRKNRNVETRNYQGGLIHAGANKDVSNRDVWNRDMSNGNVSNRDVWNRDMSNGNVSNRDVWNRDEWLRTVSTSPMLDVSSLDGDESDEIPLTNLSCSSDSEDTLIIENNKIQNLKHSSKDHIPVKLKAVFTSWNSENIGHNQRLEFVVPDIYNLSANYRAHRAAISNRADSVPESKPTKQNQYNTRVDKKLRMDCQVAVEKLKISL